MKRFCTFLFFGWLIAAPAQADQTTLAAGDVLRGQFMETRHMKGFDGPMTSEGRFTVAPGHGLIWDTQKPFAITTVITPDGLTQSIDGAKVTDLPASKMPFMLHLYEALSGALAGDWHALGKDFTVTRTEVRAGWRIEMKPRQADNIAMPFDIIVVAGEAFAEHVHMEKTDGDSEDIAFTHQAVSHAAPTAIESVLFDGSK